MVNGRHFGPGRQAATRPGPSAGPAHRARRPCRAQPAPRRHRLAPADGTAAAGRTPRWGAAPSTFHHALRCSLLESLLQRLANSPDTTPTGTTTADASRARRYGRFLDALELHFRELHQAADYAELLGCSVRTLSRAARDATGKGVRELIDERRLLEARRLLGGARWGARTVAAHLRFTDPANFGRFFRDRTGRTPGSLRGRRGHDRPASSPWL